MTIETEVKVKIEDVSDFCRRLHALHPETLSNRHFEDNHLLDFPDRRLGLQHCLLRIRFADNRHYLTFKGPPRPNGVFETREELETALEDGSVLLQALERIGMSISFRYQKYRQEFTFETILVAVDETPIGNFVEFEGSENGILDLARRMGIDESQLLRSSYYGLYMDYCRERNITPGFMVF